MVVPDTNVGNNAARAENPAADPGQGAVEKAGETVESGQGYSVSMSNDTMTVRFADGTEAVRTVDPENPRTMLFDPEQLHRQAAEAFANAGLEAAHEVSLAPRCRIDFMVGDIGVEIKKKRPQRAPLVAQLTRYANCPQIARLIVLAPRGVDLPKSIGGKPVTMMSLEKLWGIMLP